MAKKYSQTAYTNFSDPTSIKREFELRMKENVNLENRLEKVEGNFPIQFPKQQDFEQIITSNDKSIDIINNKDLSLWNYSATMHRVRTDTLDLPYEELVNRNPNIMDYPNPPLYTPTDILDGWIPFGCYSADSPETTFNTINENYNKNWLRYTTAEKLYEWNPWTRPALPPPLANPLQKRFLFFHPCPVFTENDLGAVYDINAKVYLDLSFDFIYTQPPAFFFVSGMLIIDKLNIETGLIETTDDPYDISYFFYNPAVTYSKLSVQALNTNGYAILDHKDESKEHNTHKTTEEVDTPLWEKNNNLSFKFELGGSASAYLKSNKDILSIWYKLYAYPIWYLLDTYGIMRNSGYSPVGMGYRCFQVKVNKITERLDIKYNFRNQYKSGASENIGNLRKTANIIQNF